MATAELGSGRLWPDDGPVVFVPPHLAAAGEELTGRLRGESWAGEALVFASSGTSGTPKWIVHGREGVLRSALEVNRHLGVERDDHWFLALPDFHVGGFGVLARAQAAGCGFSRLAGGWDAATFVQALSDCGATHTSLVPTQVYDLVEAGLCAPDRLRAVVVGGGALANDLGCRARALGWPVLQSYGMTEAASQVATSGMDALEGAFRNAPLPLLPHWETRLGCDGVLELRGPALFACYVVMDDGGVRREEAGVDGWFATTDRVELEGNHLRFVARNDRVVKVMGELVDLVDLETRVGELGGESARCRVVALPELRSGRRLVPVFEGRLPEAVDKALEKLNASLPGYSRLSEPLVMERWPRTPLGKVDMQALQELAATR